MWSSTKVPAGAVRRFLACVSVGGLLLAGCSSPDDIQGPDLTTPPTIDELVVPTTGLVGEWKLDEASGTVANDTKNNYDATVYGGAAFVTSPLGRALNLNNGTSGTGGKYAEMPSNATLDAVQEGNYSISAWFYPYSEPSDAVVENRLWAIVSKASPNMGLVYNKFGKFILRHYLTGDVLQMLASSSSYPINTWHHVVGTVNKSTGTMKIYVNGEPQGTMSFAAGTSAAEYGATPFRIGRAQTYWAADGRVDQVRIYNRELSAADVSNLFQESASRPAFRFYVGMSKEAIADSNVSVWTPDGKFQQVNTDLSVLLRNAHSQGRRVIIKVTRDNGYYDDAPDGQKGRFVPSLWKADFDKVKDQVDTLRKYVANGTLLGHYAIDEPFSDFTAFPPAALDDICGYQKTYWPFVPCLVRERNTRLKFKADSAGYQYTKVDAGWAQLANHHLDAPRILTDSSVQKYFRDELQAGRDEGLALLYGFNLLDGGTDDDPTDPSDCADHPNGTQCAMTPDEVRMVANAIANIGHDQGCGVNGWVVDAAATASRQYFLRSDVQDALQYLWNRTAGAGLRPGPCSLRNLPAP